MPVPASGTSNAVTIKDEPSHGSALREAICNDGMSAMPRFLNTAGVCAKTLRKPWSRAKRKLLNTGNVMRHVARAANRGRGW